MNLLEHSRFVVDASVAANLLIEQSLSLAARRFFDVMDSDNPPHLFVPGFFFLETANALRNSVKFGALERETAIQGLGNLRELPLTVVEDGKLFEMALEIALDRNVTVYDACYAALASRENALLITADRKLVAALLGSVVDAVWLGDVLVQSGAD
ncbi:MAG: type II toxin-antitoxin system VapC family toxin [Deltaproteobacteria bacterium]|nr:type II toxin-antitoxin system VapC family toxin [bacterium]MCB9479425.1 type II toxin-antitoxin system VapC family toxin [Deltaproteobacteria bacterium]MCB9488617.1 type II toxin-antitoxin system VapC family toxin [Deltaproteobacteria bacterium]